MHCILALVTVRVLLLRRSTYFRHCNGKSSKNPGPATQEYLMPEITACKYKYTVYIHVYIHVQVQVSSLAHVPLLLMLLMPLLLMVRILSCDGMPMVRI